MRFMRSLILLRTNMSNALGCLPIPHPSGSIGGHIETIKKPTMSPLHTIIAIRWCVLYRLRVVVESLTQQQALLSS